MNKKQAPTPSSQPLVLASSSPFRRQLLQRLGLPFIVQTPAIDEQPKPNEPAPELVLRLASEKAQAVANDHAQSLIIGSDQVAVLDEQILGKPGTHDKAMVQLQAASGNEVRFYTALVLLNSQTGRLQSAVCQNSAYFRDLNAASIERYLNHEQPYQCAGSFKAEGLGISLFTKLTGDDPNALIGLPLIKLVEMLAHEGIAVP